jgi:hypothetical protein
MAEEDSIMAAEPTTKSKPVFMPYENEVVVPDPLPQRTLSRRHLNELANKFLDLFRKRAYVKYRDSIAMEVMPTGRLGTYSLPKPVSKRRAALEYLFVSLSDKSSIAYVLGDYEEDLKELTIEYGRAYAESWYRRQLAGEILYLALSKPGKWLRYSVASMRRVFTSL